MNKVALFVISVGLLGTLTALAESGNGYWIHKDYASARCDEAREIATSRAMLACVGQGGAGMILRTEQSCTQQAQSSCHCTADVLCGVLQ